MSVHTFDPNDLRRKAKKNKSTKVGVTVKNGEQIKPKPIDWLWHGWLARGKFHLMAGSPGTGKTTVAMSLCAIVTEGGHWPDGGKSDVGNVMIWTGEDDLADTLVPRLLACGAVMERVNFVVSMTDEKGPRSFDPATDIEELDDYISTMESPPSVLVIDPIVSAVAGDSHKNAEVRRSLQPLVDLAAKYRCAMIGITHFSKGSGGRDPVERMTGSLAFGALGRMGMVAAKMSEGQGRVLARAKSNNASDEGGFAYDLEVCEPVRGIETTKVVWGEKLEGTAREILSKAEVFEDPEEQSSLSDAIGFLRGLLADGPVSSKQIQKDARDCGYAWRTIERAKKKLDVLSKKDPGGPWMWQLNPDLSTKDRQDRQDFSSGGVGGLGGLGKKSSNSPNSDKVNGDDGCPKTGKENSDDDDLSDVFGDAPWEPV